MTARAFDLGDVLSITHDRLLSPRHIEGVYDILGWMTGDSLFTHQLPRAGATCKAPLRAQHPDLEAIVVPDTITSEETLKEWLDAVKVTYGATRNVTPLAERDSQDPLDELCDMVGAERVYVIEGQEDA